MTADSGGGRPACGGGDQAVCRRGRTTRRRRDRWWVRPVPPGLAHCFTSGMEPSGSLKLRSAVASDVGRRRDANEDSVYTSPWLLAVADGMGGHVAGEVASSGAIAAVTELDQRLD